MSARARILLFGANGQVGTELRRSLASMGEVIATTRSGALPDGTPCERADFDDPGTLAPIIERIAPDIVVNAAAYTAVDRAEDDADAAYRANAEAPGVIADACTRCGARLVHYSTDYVFDGTSSRPYREDDPTSPLGVYGASKLAGEQAIQASGCRHMIFRTAWVYAAHGKNFLLTMLRLARERDELRVVDDQVGSPTSAVWIAEATRRALLDAGAPSGLWHLTSLGSTSWHGFAKAALEAAATRGLIERMPRMVAIHGDEFPTRAARPAYSVLDNSRWQATFSGQTPDWESGMQQVLGELDA